MFLAFRGLLFFFLCILFMGGTDKRPDRSSIGQETNPQQIQKPTYDYMSNFLSRSTRPLGLKDNPTLRAMLNQKAPRWALRAGIHHVLD